MGFRNQNSEKQKLYIKTINSQTNTTNTTNSKAITLRYLKYPLNTYI